MAEENTMSENEMAQYLEADYFADFKNTSVINYAKKAAGNASKPKDIAINLYYCIRDDFFYDPYNMTFEKSAFRASDFVNQKSGHCIDKANLLVACSRFHNIPARYRFANVKNHIATEKIEVMLKTNILAFHGMAELFLNNKWVKLTPAFNKTLCEKLNVDTLEFDGEKGDIFQEYNKEGASFMEYVYDHGSFTRFPHKKFMDTIYETYPHLKGKTRLL